MKSQADLDATGPSARIACPFKKGTNRYPFLIEL